MSSSLLIRCLLLTVTLGLLDTAQAAVSAGRVAVGGGFHDNVDLAAEGDPDKEDSLFARAAVGLGFDWNTSAGDRFYIDLDNDNALILSSGKSSFLFFRATPGFFFTTLGNQLEADVSLTLASNTSFDNSTPEDDDRTANVRTARPLQGRSMLNASGAGISSSSTYFQNGFRIGTLYNFGGFKLGPALRWIKTDFSKAPQEDTLVVFSAQASVAFSSDLKARFELGIADTNSSIDGLGSSGPLLGASLNWDLPNGFGLQGHYQYLSRDFENPSTRDDNLHEFGLKLTKTLSGYGEFIFDYQRVSNDSSAGGAEYTANVLTAGMAWRFL